MRGIFMNERCVCVELLQTEDVTHLWTEQGEEKQRKWNLNVVGKRGEVGGQWVRLATGHITAQPTNLL